MNTRKNLVIAVTITLLVIGFGGLVVANQQLVTEAASLDSANPKKKDWRYQAL